MRPKIGLVLGGGGSRGVAHIGVLKVFARENIPIDLIVGTSMGGIIGTLYALDYSPDRIGEHMLQNMKGSNLLNMNIFSARARQNSVQEQLKGAIAEKTFADLKIPVTLMAVDMRHGKEILLNEGKLMPAVLATTAVPGVFPPVAMDDMLLADGGVIDSLATHVAYEQGADIVIAVDVYPELEKDNPWIDPVAAITGIELPFGSFSFTNDWERIPSALASIWRSTRVMTWYLHEQRLEAHPPHVLLHPDVDKFSSMDFKDMMGPMMAGLAEAENHLDEIRALVNASAA